MGRGATPFAPLNANFNTSPQHIIFDGVAAITQSFTAPQPGFYRFFVDLHQDGNGFLLPDNPVEVRIDGVLIGTIIPELFTPPFNFDFTLATAGAHSIELRSTVSSGAYPTLLDDVGVYFVSNFPADPAAGISGTVFRDFNGNGLQEANEPLMPGVTVNAYNNTGALCGTAVTFSGISGPNYELSGCGTAPVRVEFVMPTGEPFVDAATDYPSLSGNTYGTSVQFVNGNSSDVNFAITNPYDYNIGSPEVELFLPCYVSGNPLGGGATGTTDWFVSFDYPNSTGNPPNRKVDGTVLGATWGTAYSKQADRVFTSAVLKRHIGLGTLGTGGIYMLEPTATSFNVTEFYDMDANGHRTRADASAPTYGEGSSFNTISGIFNQGGVVYNGSIDPVSGQPAGLGVVGSNVDRGLSPSPTVPSHDHAAFDQVGKVGLGGLELSDDGRFLFVTNLYSRSIYRLELDDPKNPSSIVNVTEISLPSISCTDGELRPWALSYNRGKFYAGAVCTGENGSTAANLQAYVFEMENPETNTAFVSAPLISFPLDGPRLGFPMNPWSNLVQLIGSGYARWPSPILSDFSFGNNGQLIINFLDRFGLQHESNNYFFLNYADGQILNIATSSDLFIAGLDPATGNYQLESDKTYESNDITFRGVIPREINFFNDNRAFDGNTLGSSVYLPGLPGVTVGQFEFSSQRAYDLSFFDGTQSNIFTIVDNSTAPGAEEKGLGLGEFDLSGPNAPIEIGNRVWADTDGDGVQDPDEGGIAGLEVQLWKDDGGTFTQIATVTTAADGTYYFSSDVGTSTTGITYGVSQLQPDMNYELRFPTTAIVGGNTLNLTLINMGGSDPNADERDSDADRTTAVVSLNTGSVEGANDHSFDVGYTMIANLDLEKTFVSATLNGNGTFSVNYTITVMETNGVPGTYDLEDTPGFDDDIIINSGSYSGQAMGSLNTTGSTTLTTGESIAAGATHTYNLTFNVTLDLSDGMGDNIYTPCSGATPMPGQGLYNLATLTTDWHVRR